MIDAMISLALGALVTARLTRFVTTDRVFLAPRAWFIKKLDRESLTAYLIVCDWCVSVYAGAAVAATQWSLGVLDWRTAAFAALAYSYVAGWLAERTGE